MASNELTVVGSLIDQIPRFTDARLEALWGDNSDEKVPYGSNFQLVEVPHQYRIVELQALRKRCILSSFMNYTVLMEECMAFEHN